MVISSSSVESTSHHYEPLPDDCRVLAEAFRNGAAGFSAGLRPLGCEQTLGLSLVDDCLSILRAPSEGHVSSWLVLPHAIKEGMEEDTTASNVIYLPAAQQPVPAPSAELSLPQLSSSDPSRSCILGRGANC